MAAIAPSSPLERRLPASDRRLASVTSIARAPASLSDGMRVSWAGVWGGVLAAVGLLLLLASLGVAVGITAADPARIDAVAVGSSAAIWGAASLLLALFVGGLVSTRAGAIHDRATSFWEGFLVWVVSLLLVACLAATGIGSLASGAVHALGRVAEVQPMAAKVAWATFGALVLSLAAAVMGSAVGRRRAPAVVR